MHGVFSGIIVFHHTDILEKQCAVIVVSRGGRTDIHHRGIDKIDKHVPVGVDFAIIETVFRTVLRARAPLLQTPAHIVARRALRHGVGRHYVYVLDFTEYTAVDCESIFVSAHYKRCRKGVGRHLATGGEDSTVAQAGSGNLEYGLHGAVDAEIGYAHRIGDHDLGTVVGPDSTEGRQGCARIGRHPHGSAHEKGKVSSHNQRGLAVISI